MTKFSQKYKVTLKPTTDSNGVVLTPVEIVEAEDFEVETSGNHTYIRFYKDENKDEDGNFYDTSVALFPYEQVASITTR